MFGASIHVDSDSIDFVQCTNLFLTLSAQDDYIPSCPFEITFPPGSRRQLYNVAIVNDAIPENSEFFNAYVSSASPKEVIIGDPRQPLIEILDSGDSE